MSFNHKPAYHDNSMDEYHAKIAEQHERYLARECGMNAAEASNYTPAQMQARLQRPQRQQTKRNEYRATPGTRTLYRSFKLSNGTRWTIWDADVDICPVGLRGINNPVIDAKFCAKY